MFGGSKNDLIDGFLFEYVKMGLYLWPEQLPQHRGIAWIREIRIEVVFDKIEKCQQAYGSNTLCLRFTPFGELIHEANSALKDEYIFASVLFFIFTTISSIYLRVGRTCDWEDNGYPLTLPTNKTAIYNKVNSCTIG